MTHKAVVGGVAAGALSLPLVLAAATTGGLVAAITALFAVVLVSGSVGAVESTTQSCHRCGELNDGGCAVCTACQAQL